MKKGMNSTEMQKTNRTLVLKTLLENGSMTRTDLALKVGLQKATITNIINEFLEMGIIAIDGDSASGRRGELICLKLDGMYVMAISINRKDYRISIYTLDGKKVSYAQEQFTKNDDIHKIVNNLKADAVKIVEEYGRDKIIGISLGLPGPYIRKSNNQAKEMMIVSDFEQLSIIDMHEELENVLGLTVLSEHDAKLSAFAEWKNAIEAQKDKNVSLLALSSVGIGIGAGIIINGKIVRGQLGIAGEIGHMGINYNAIHTNTRTEGTYEYCAGTESAIRYMLERRYEFPNSKLNEYSTYQDVVTAYSENDPLAIYAIEKMAWMLGYGIANIVYILNPDCIIIGQDYPKSSQFMDKVQESVKAHTHPYILENISIRLTTINEDSVLLGGFYFVLDKLFRENLFLNQIQKVIGHKSEEDM